MTDTSYLALECRVFNCSAAQATKGGLPAATFHERCSNTHIHFRWRRKTQRDGAALDWPFDKKAVNAQGKRVTLKLDTMLPGSRAQSIRNHMRLTAERDGVTDKEWNGHGRASDRPETTN